METAEHDALVVWGRFHRLVRLACHVYAVGEQGEPCKLPEPALQKRFLCDDSMHSFGIIVIAFDNELTVGGEVQMKAVLQLHGVSLQVVAKKRNEVFLR